MRTNDNWKNSIASVGNSYEKDGWRRLNCSPFNGLSAAASDDGPMQGWQQHSGDDGDRPEISRLRALVAFLVMRYPFWEPRRSTAPLWTCLGPSLFHRDEIYSAFCIDSPYYLISFVAFSLLSYFACTTFNLVRPPRISNREFFPERSKTRGREPFETMSSWKWARLWVRTWYAAPRRRLRVLEVEKRTLSNKLLGIRSTVWRKWCLFY